jgi:peroxiredoxin
LRKDSLKFGNCVDSSTTGVESITPRRARVHSHGAVPNVLAVSTDPPEARVAFAEALKLPFPILPDVGRNLCVLYEAARDAGDRAARQSVLIDHQGRVVWIEREIKVGTHGPDVVAKVRELELDKPTKN